MTKKVHMIVCDLFEELETFMPFYALKMNEYEVDAVYRGKKAEETILCAIHDKVTE